MVAQRNPKSKKLKEQLDKETTFAAEEAKNKAEITHAQPKVKSHLKSGEAHAKTQKALRVAPSRVKEERQARAKAEIQETLAATRRKDENQARIKRVSFVVRLALDKNGQFGRTEIEHVSSSRKQNFPSLNGEGLVAFMKTCIRPTIISKATIPVVPYLEKIEAPRSESSRSVSRLIVSNVQLFRHGDPDLATLIVIDDDPFVVRTYFKLQGPDVQFIFTQKSSFEIKIYATEFSSGNVKLITIHRTRVIPNNLEYTFPIEVSGLSQGLFRLFTIVTLNADIKMVGYHDGPTFQVMKQDFDLTGYAPTSQGPSPREP
ncbi:MAG TPA: hypothetical protein VK206_09920 [Anaerolineales bacterium]|nr:hypothetical protein [Anaerolineales bacterium]